MVVYDIISSGLKAVDMAYIKLSGIPTKAYKKALSTRSLF
jgi:hypothetical protein